MDRSLFQVAHFKEKGMLLEKPTSVEPGHTVLENPTFALIGVLLKVVPAAWHFISITPTTLFYCHIHAEEIKLHLYLIPSDCTIQQVNTKNQKIQRNS